MEKEIDYEKYIIHLTNGNTIFFGEDGYSYWQFIPGTKINGRIILGERIASNFSEVTGLYITKEPAYFESAMSYYPKSSIFKIEFIKQ